MASSSLKAETSHYRPRSFRGSGQIDDYISLRTGRQPEFHHFLKDTEEEAKLIEILEAWRAEEKVDDRDLCIAARSKKLLTDRYAQILDKAGIPWCLVETDPQSEQAQDGVRLATMHRLKGLEFPRMILVSVQDGVVPPPSALAAAADEVSREDVELQERCLLYVAMTRARDELVVMG